MIDEGITLKKLEIFLVFMRAGTLKATANILGLSPVAIHKALHSLEEGMHCPLFRHQGRVLIPLPSAHNFMNHCERLFNQLNLGIKETQETVGVFSDSLRLGTLYSLTFDMVPKVLTGLQRRTPTLKVTMSQGSNEWLYSQLEEMEIDVILIAMAPDTRLPGYTILPIYEDEMMVAVSKSSPFHWFDVIDLHRLQNEKLITLNHGFATYHDCVQSFENAGVEPQVMMQVGDIFTLLSMVESGIGYSLVPARVQEKFSDNIHFIKISDQHAVKQMVSLVCLESKERDPKILSCIAECRLYALNQSKVRLSAVV